MRDIAHKFLTKRINILKAINVENIGVDIQKQNKNGY